MTDTLPYETWMPVVGYEGLYKVSDRGRVTNNTGRYLTPYPRRTGKNKRIQFYTVNLSRDGIAKTKKVHRLVLEAFIGLAPDGLQCCHEDGNCANNVLSNLRWDTASSNVRDSIRHGTYVRAPRQGRGSNKYAWLREDDVRCIMAEPYWRGVVMMLARSFGVSRKTIERVRAGY